MTDWTDRAVDFMILYDEEKSLWQIGKRSSGRFVAVRHDSLLVDPSPKSLPHAISEMVLQQHEFSTEAEARSYVRCYSAEKALRAMFADRYEISLT